MTNYLDYNGFNYYLEREEILFFRGEIMKNKKKDRLYLCFRYHCKQCPKERICSEKLKKKR